MDRSLKKKIIAYAKRAGWIECGTKAETKGFVLLPSMEYGEAGYLRERSLCLFMPYDAEEFAPIVNDDTEIADSVNAWCADVMETWISDRDAGGNVPNAEKIGSLIKENAKRYTEKLLQMRNGIEAIMSMHVSNTNPVGEWVCLSSIKPGFCDKISGHITMAESMDSDSWNAFIRSLTETAGVQFEKNRATENGWWVMCDAKEDLSKAAALIMAALDSRHISEGIITLYDDENLFAVSYTFCGV